MSEGAREPYQDKHDAHYDQRVLKGKAGKRWWS
jgi:hypothetical protein